MYFKNYNKIFLFLLISLFSISYVNSACLDNPTKIEVISGAYSLGDKSYSQSSNGIYIKGDLSANPLKIKLKFDNIDNDCFASNEDVELRLFTSGTQIPASSIKKVNNQTIVEFIFNVKTTAPQTFVSQYIVKHKNNLEGKESSIKFLVDDENPELNLDYTPQITIVKPQTQININYMLSDLKSGLDTLVITGGKNQIIQLNESSSYSNSITEILNSTKTYTFTLKDKLGNQKTQTIKYIVDSTKPTFFDLKVQSYMKDSSGRYASLEFKIKDNSYEVLDNIPVVYGDLSTIDAQSTNVLASCIRDSNFKDTYICNFNNIKISKIEQTSKVDIKLKSTDYVGNIADSILKVEIFYDNKGPVITDFYLINSIGQKDIFNSQDTNVLVILEFSDESLDNQLKLNEFTVIDDFDGSFFVIPQISYNNSKARYVWNLTNYIKKYSGLEKGSVTFKVSIFDTYSNPSQKQINISFNNKKPLIRNIEFIENDFSTDGSIKDGIITSKEKINFRMLFDDENLILDSKFIFADFYSITHDNNLKKTQGRCSKYNSTTYQCDFGPITIDNGYLEKEVYFIIIDTAGNMVVKSYLVEIFSRGEEVPESFKIDDVKIINILNRNLLKNPPAGRVDSWFKGTINDIEGREGMIIVNYQLKSCNDSQMNPILLGSRNLFPQSVVKAQESNEANRNFITKVEVKAHTNYVDLNTKTLKCTMSVLKRDNQTLYPVELVPFNLIFEFYDLPNDNLLNAQASNILDMAEDAQGLGSLFDSLWSVYEMMNTVCTTVSTANSIISTINNVWVPISIVLHGTGYGKAAAYNGDNALIPAKDGIAHLVTNPEGFIKKACDFVTCRNGGLLSNFWSGTEMGQFFEKVNSGFGFYDNPFGCQEVFTKEGKSTTLDYDQVNAVGKSTWGDSSVDN